MSVFKNKEELTDFAFNIGHELYKELDSLCNMKRVTNGERPQVMMDAIIMLSVLVIGNTSKSEEDVLAEEKYLTTTIQDNVREMLSDK